MKIKSTVLNSTFAFYGLMLEGDATEFGYRNSGHVSNICNLEQIYTIINSYKSNITGIVSAERTASGSIQLNLASNIHLYDFPMLYIGANGQVQEIPNGVTIVEQYVMYSPERKQDIVVSYGVLFDFDSKQRHSRQTVGGLAALSTYFRPKNYVVKQLPNGDISFSGKAGVSLKSMPVIRLDRDEKGQIPVGAGIKTTTQLKNASVSQDVYKKGQTDASQTAVDFLDVLNIAKEAGATIVYLPKTDGAYTALTVDTTSVKTDFVPSNIELAAPEISYSEKTAKTNLLFKKMGKVFVPFNGTKVPVPCMMMSNKSVFNIEKQHMLKLMLSVPRDKVDIIQNKLLAKTLTFTVCSEMTLCSLVNAALGVGQNDNILLDIDTTRLIPLSRKVAEQFLQQDMYELVLRLQNLKALQKWIRFKQDNLAGMVPNVGLRSVKPEYAAYAQEMIANIKAYGIDPETGIYTPQETGERITSSGAGSVPIEMEFVIPGFKAPTQNELSNLEAVKAGKMARYLQAAFQAIDEVQVKLQGLDARDVAGMNSLLTETAKTCKANINKTTRNIWCYNQSALLMGNYKTFKDGQVYQEANSRMKSGHAYSRMTAERPLTLKLKGVELDSLQLKQ